MPSNPTLPPPPIAPPPPPVIKKKPDPVQVSTGVLEAHLKTRVNPVYPELARQTHVTGKVVLIVNVDEEGNVSDIKVSSGHILLNGEAIKAVKQWKYTPTLLSGEPVPVVATVTVIFNLK